MKEILREKIQRANLGWSDSTVLGLVLDFINNRGFSDELTDHFDNYIEVARKIKMASGSDHEEEALW